MGRHGSYSKSIAYLDSHGIYTIRYGIGMGLVYMVLQNTYHSHINIPEMSRYGSDMGHTRDP